MDGFSRDICTFNRRSLRQVQTRVKTADGRSFVESKDETGTICVEASAPHDRSVGFVPDLTPDLQLGEVLPGLYVGEFKSTDSPFFPSSESVAIV